MALFFFLSSFNFAQLSESESSTEFQRSKDFVLLQVLTRRKLRMEECTWRAALFYNSFLIFCRFQSFLKSGNHSAFTFSALLASFRVLISINRMILGMILTDKQIKLPY